MRERLYCGDCRYCKVDNNEQKCGCLENKKNKDRPREFNDKMQCPFFKYAWFCFPNEK